MDQRDKYGLKRRENREKKKLKKIKIIVDEKKGCIGIWRKKKKNNLVLREV